jgi:hypothetical protein
MLLSVDPDSGVETVTLSDADVTQIVSRGGVVVRISIMTCDGTWKGEAYDRDTGRAGALLDRVYNLWCCSRRGRSVPR